ncbi:unnamed protein product, partial [Protopolystoma xenopodis]
SSSRPGSARSRRRARPTSHNKRLVSSDLDLCPLGEVLSEDEETKDELDEGRSELSIGTSSDFSAKGKVGKLEEDGEEEIYSAVSWNPEHEMKLSGGKSESPVTYSPFDLRLALHEVNNNNYGISLLGRDHSPDFMLQELVYWEPVVSVIRFQTHVFIFYVKKVTIRLGIKLYKRRGS